MENNSEFPIILDNYHNNTLVKFYIYKNCIISDHLKNNKIWEPHLHIIFEKYINKNSIVLEAGCHIGSHTIKLGLLAKQLYVFEPMPTSFEILKKNVEVNNLNNIILFKKGLSNKLGNTTFAWIIDNNPGASGLSDNPMGIPNNINKNKDNILVELITIDSLNLNKLDFIKIDVEGYEELVIQGGIETIKRCKPIMIIEIWKDHNSGVSLEFSKNKFKCLLDIGYKCIHIQNTPDFLFIIN